MNLPSFIKQTALRSIAIFLVKAIGLAFRIPLFRILGSEGTGIYQIVYSIYGFTLTLISGGFPTSLALMTAKDKTRGWQFFRNMSIPFFVFGTSIGLLCYVLAPYIAIFLGDGKLAIPIRFMAPALAIVPLLQLYRGFLQGLEHYGIESASQLIEQIVRVITMLFLVVVWMKYGIHTSVGGAVFGAFTGALVALGFLWMLHNSKKLPSFTIRYGRHEKKSIRWLVFGPGLFWFIKSSLAITLTRLMVPASDFLDAIIIPNRLQISGLSQSEAFAIFGEIFGMAATIVYLPTIITAALSFTIAPKLTADWENQKKRDFVVRSNLSLEIGWFWGIGSIGFLFFHADELAMFIFGSTRAADAIRYLSFVPLITGMRELTTTMLWAADQKRIPLIGLLFGLICSAASAYFLVAIPNFGYAGAAISILGLELSSLLWNAVFLRKRCIGIFPLFPLLLSLIFLAAIVFLYPSFESFLLYIGAESAIIRSTSRILFLTICLILYLVLRFWRKLRLP
ncbi:polysaccharide biosynthesis protein [Paenibacillus sp. KQZ6P-2]|uniref:Polysaccharide biosynthesis protein n=1 Tax=Paenibacillus mangrovi TaxID=2931978 RepID=A0A9X1WJD3_9BACL|nr:polysaccharide biosynthesis protein [Paenibacillus mangrovi]MCJ8010447.1 polysaccharide biosynthesis protein [Paenibacillus mangrovi]